MLICPLQFTRMAMYVVGLRGAIIVCACVCLSESNEAVKQEMPSWHGTPLEQINHNRLMSYQLVLSARTHTNSHTHSFTVWPVKCVICNASCAFCNLPRKTENTVCPFYQGACREMNDWSQWPLYWDYYAPADSLSPYDFAGKIVTLQHAFHFVIWWWKPRHPVENDGNSVKSQIKCESKTPVDEKDRNPRCQKPQRHRENDNSHFMYHISSLRDYKIDASFSCSVGYE